MEERPGRVSAVLRVKAHRKSGSEGVRRHAGTATSRAVCDSTTTYDLSIRAALWILAFIPVNSPRASTS
jgi:hypothetical protein